MNIVLIGMMGSGKSTVGRILASRLKWKFCDSDAVIEKKEGMSIADIFDRKGEKKFREIEKKTVRHLVRTERTVIALGGGAPCFEENWKAIPKESFVVWLKAGSKELLRRLRKEPLGVRPLVKNSLLNLKNINKILSARRSFYERAQRTVTASRLSPEKAAEKIIKFYKAKLRDIK